MNVSARARSRYCAAQRQPSPSVSPQEQRTHRSRTSADLRVGERPGGRRAHRLDGPSSRSTPRSSPARRPRPGTRAGPQGVSPTGAPSRHAEPVQRQVGNALHPRPGCVDPPVRPANTDSGRSGSGPSSWGPACQSRPASTRSRSAASTASTGPGSRTRPCTPPTSPPRAVGRWIWPRCLRRCATSSARRAGSRQNRAPTRRQPTPQRT